MIRALITIYITKVISYILKNVFKKGTSMPGLIAKKLCPNILKYASKNTTTILITGTNGKTTTTSMIYNMVKSSNNACFSNLSGANMECGIITSFIDNYTMADIKRIAVIEIDEANVPLVCKNINPAIVVITNLFRDQLDRYGEVYTTLEKIMSGVNLSDKSTLILNGDEPMLGSLTVPNKKVFYGFNISPNTDEIEMNTDAKHCIYCKTPYTYDFVTYNHLGYYHCPNCNYTRPTLNHSVDNIISMNPNESVVSFDGQEYTVSQAGLYNIYNALCAYAVAKELHIDDNIIADILKNQESRFGRQEIVNIGDKQMTIFLVKNPAGFNQTIDTIALDNNPFSCLFMLNDNYADGTDVSWIYDVNLEKLQEMPIENILVSGIRAYDMAIRLKIATNQKDKINVYENYEELLKAIKAAPTKKVYATLTYTAMLDFRKFLEAQGYIKEYWR